VLEADLVATAVRAFMKEQGGEEWVGTSSKLLAALGELVDESHCRGRDWPSSPSALSGRLRRAATNLRKAAIEVAFEREGHLRTRIIRITAKQPEKEAHLVSAASAGGKTGNGNNCLGADSHADDLRATRPGAASTASAAVAPRPHCVRGSDCVKPLKTKNGDDADDADDELRTQSGADPNDGADPGDIPDFLRRHPDNRCDHCGGHLGIMNRWDWPGRPDGIWLHPRCEELWHDSEGRLQRPPARSATYPPAPQPAPGPAATALTISQHEPGDQ
jgi:hypothetical protein